ncbi:hypothetical protein BJ138DRAFT_494847 [Hygrophoropsis aurantiaca]|uniref:Uncharacterized protein n=1 Tax=Hygrophoropsis aurantiaca TaxID=72124 RepID=A0ACB8A2W0_9AGAM|nr:hypothetical protein BJ138DRAFT_494847 [Hygrophoropsis aurantiaca]
MSTISPYLDNIGGAPLVIGYSLSFCLMGFLTLQTYIYFKRFSTDPIRLRAFVWVLFVTELLITGFTLHGFWVGAINNSLMIIVGITLEDVKFLVLWSLKALACLTGFVSFITHGFFCWRIWCLKRSCLIPIFVMMISLLQFSMVAYGGIMYGLCPTMNIGDFYNPNFEFSIPIWLSGSLMCDTIITIYMVTILHQEGAKSSFQSTKSLSTKLIKLTIETGLVTTLAAVTELILATVLSETVWHLAVFYTISKLYANCVLANLNSRKALKDSENDHATFLSSVQANTSNPALINKRPHVMKIMKTMETDVEMNSSVMSGDYSKLRYLTVELLISRCRNTSTQGPWHSGAVLTANPCR